MASEPSEQPVSQSTQATADAPTALDGSAVSAREYLKVLAKDPCTAETATRGGDAAAEAAGSSGGAKTKSEPAAPAKVDEAPKLPPLSPAEFRAYNRLAEHMDYFHEHFRQTWNMMHKACTSGKRPSNMSLKQFINEGLQFVRHLETHHGIEESYMYPVLARKMPQFAAHPPKGKHGGGSGTKKSGNDASDREREELIEQHKEIHEGMEVFEEYLRQCRAGEIELELSVMRQKMDSWGGVLWRHMDQEVVTLGAETMRQYWTLQEMREMPF